MAGPEKQRTKNNQYTKKGAYSLEEAMTNLADRAKAAGLGYERPMKAAQEARAANKRKKLSK
jgi:uncharacterized protein YaiL (DUF2058 family)